MMRGGGCLCFDDHFVMETNIYKPSVESAEATVLQTAICLCPSFPGAQPGKMTED